MDIFKSMEMYIENSLKSDAETKNKSDSPSHDPPAPESEGAVEIECDHCEFKDKKEKNIENHVLAEQCHICDYVTKDGSLLDTHLTNEHFKPRFVCFTCDSTFHTERMLKDHEERHRS